MEKGNIILITDLVVDFLAIAGFLYLFSKGYFTDLEGASLDRLFMQVGVVGLILAGITIYLLLKKE
jgi:hypothetical protein